MATIKMCDISDFQESAHYDQVKAAGYDAIGIKMSEGESWQAKLGASHRAGATAAGLSRILYGFFHQNDNPILMARNLAGMVKTLEPLEGFALDVEAPASNPHEVLTLHGLAVLEDTITEAEQLLGRKMTYLYGSEPYIMGGRLSAEELAPLGDYALWKPAYPHSSHIMPPPFPCSAAFGPWKQVAAWQCSSTVIVPGVYDPEQRGIDVSYIYSDLPTFNLLLVQ
jgi:GH25 family lysozyme M1 (1,4-beta-N-acetylmuramidase)